MSVYAISSSVGAQAAAQRANENAYRASIGLPPLVPIGLPPLVPIGLPPLVPEPKTPAEIEQDKRDDFCNAVTFWFLLIGSAALFVAPIGLLLFVVLKVAFKLH